MSEEPSDFTYSQKSLDEDEFAEADPITAYPDGASIMPVSVTADWNGEGYAAEITTYRTGNIGIQFGVWAQGDNDTWATRKWDSVAEEWREWLDDFATEGWVTGNFAPFFHVHGEIEPLDFTPTESETFPTVDGWLDVLMFYPVAGADNYGPNTGEAGIVQLQIAQPNKVQTFNAFNGNMYRRIYTSGSWGSWGQITIT